MILRLVLSAVVVCLALIGQGASFAHTQKAAIATIEPNARTGMIEIVHRFSQHDAEHAAHLFGATPESIITSKDVQKKFADYIVNSFKLYTLEGDVITLDEIGFEFDNGYIWVYQEAEMLKDVAGLTVEYSALHEIWPDQTNTVNIKLDGGVKTLVFRGHSQIKDVVFDLHADKKHSHKTEQSTHSHNGRTHTH